jgi:hypothetical protein
MEDYTYDRSFEVDNPITCELVICFNNFRKCGRIKMTKPSYRKALAIAKAVKLQLASVSDGIIVRMTAEDKAKAYAVANRKQGDTPTDLANKLKLQRSILKDCGF